MNLLKVIYFGALLLMSATSASSNTISTTNNSSQCRKDASPEFNTPTSQSPHHEPSVACCPDEVTLRIPKSLVGLSTSPGQVMFRRDASERCRSSEASSYAFQLSFDLDDEETCGSDVKKEGPKIVSYSNEVVYLNEKNFVLSLISFTCLYYDGIYVPALPASYRKEIITDRSDSSKKLSLEIILYRDASFSSSSLIKERFPLASVEKFVFVEVSLEGMEALAEKSRFFIDKCFASLNPDLSSKNKAVHGFIENGCADVRDSTVQVLNESESSLIRFKFQMFKWSNMSVQRIYLFCLVSFCASANSCNITSNSCENKVSVTRQQRVTQPKSSNPVKRAVEGHKADLTLGIGPIFPIFSAFLRDKSDASSDDSDENNDPFVGNKSIDHNSLHIAVGVAAAVTFLIIAFALYALWRRHKQRQQQQVPPLKPTKEDRIQPGFAFVLRSSDDNEVFNQSQNSEEQSRENGKKLDGKRGKSKKADAVNMELEENERSLHQNFGGNIPSNLN
ncbi:unnamed protein product [Clavelina lepadiformis]|uniref:ZP domain-containing protein n=1 Tax=Clavelina lepadiformis TaxID=159417 RepID=A0ABP0G3B4_CLALP